MEGHMLDYKLYYIGRDGHVERRQDYHAPDDVAALEYAQQHCEPLEIEVWIGARFVARVAADGTASERELVSTRTRAG
jgi:hypothetical protein